MAKKFELTGETKVVCGVTLHRIRALLDFGGVKAGDLGGWLDSDANLDHAGDAWVSGNAEVSGDAHVYGNALIRGTAHVDNDNAIFLASNVGSENGTLTVTKAQGGGLLATRGCFTGTIEKFLAQSTAVHDEKTQLEYQLLMQFARIRILGEMPK